MGIKEFEPLANTSNPSGPLPVAEDEEIVARVNIAMAVAHHDNGWSEWDWAPRLDPRTGKPRDFREMRMLDATAIWTKSVASREKLYPLAAYGISRHFCYLAELVQNGGRHDPDDLAAVGQFLKQQSGVQDRLEQQAASFGHGEALLRYRELCYRTVQFFDGVSLWLCCAEEHEPGSMTAPRGETVTISPQPAPTCNGRDATAKFQGLQITRPDYREWHVTLDPYPLSDDSHEFRVEARRIPARQYQNDADLTAVWQSAPTVQLAWTLARS